MPLAFRTAIVADISLLRKLADRIWRISYPGMVSVEQIEYMLGWMYAEEKIVAEFASGMHWEIALLDEAPVGYLSVEFQSAAVAELHKLYLLAEQQGRGFGRAMLAHVIEMAAARGCTELRLRVNKRNARALRCYDRAGFHVIDAIVADIGGGYVMDDFVLARTLP